MTFEDVLNEAVAMLQRQGRVSYRALKRQFALEDDYLEDLKEAVLYAYLRWLTMAKGSSGRANHQHGSQRPQAGQRPRAGSTRCCQL